MLLLTHSAHMGLTLHAMASQHWLKSLEALAHANLLNVTTKLQSTGSLVASELEATVEVPYTDGRGF